MVPEFLGGLSDVLALEARDGLLVVAYLAATVTGRDVSRTIGTSTSNLAHAHLLLAGVGHAHHSKTEMEQEADETPQGGFVSSMLGSRSGKCTANLSDKRISHPELTERVHECFHLGRSRSKSCTGTYDQS